MSYRADENSEVVNDKVVIESHESDIGQTA